MTRHSSQRSTHAQYVTGQAVLHVYACVCVCVCTCVAEGGEGDAAGWAGAVVGKGSSMMLGLVADKETEPPHSPGSDSSSAGLPLGGWWCKCRGGRG